MTRPPCVRLYPACPGNPRLRIEGELPQSGKDIRSALMRATNEDAQRCLCSGPPSTSLHGKPRCANIVGATSTTRAGSSRVTPGATPWPEIIMKGDCSYRPARHVDRIPCGRACRRPAWRQGSSRECRRRSAHPSRRRVGRRRRDRRRAPALWKAPSPSGSNTSPAHERLCRNERSSGSFAVWSGCT